jgi:hypothetical protein
MSDKPLVRVERDGPLATIVIDHPPLEGGARGADSRTPQIVGPLFATEDLQSAVKSFLRDGPGQATFQGR